MNIPIYIPLLSLGLVVGGCSRQSSGRTFPSVAYGSVMADVGRRFELLGRASAAGRYELAEYELGELVEQFQDVLPHAAPPREGHPEVLPRMERAFLRAEVADLQRALASRDRAAASAAFERTATACNTCHRASGHAFIEVPTIPGRSVPNTEPTGTP